MLPAGWRTCRHEAAELRGTRGAEWQGKQAAEGAAPRPAAGLLHLPGEPPAGAGTEGCGSPASARSASTLPPVCGTWGAGTASGEASPASAPSASLRLGGLENRGKRGGCPPTNPPSPTCAASTCAPAAALSALAAGAAEAASDAAAGTMAATTGARAVPGGTSDAEGGDTAPGLGCAGEAGWLRGNNGELGCECGGGGEARLERMSRKPPDRRRWHGSG